MRFMQRNSAVVAILTAGVALGGTSCSDALDPVRSLVPSIRKVEGPLPYGITYSVGAGATNASPSYGGLPYASTGVSVPPGAVARVHASGDLTLTENSECQGVFWGDMTSPVTPHGGVNGFGKVNVNFSTSLDWGTDWRGSTPDEYYIHLTNSEDTIPLALMANRKGIQGECWVPPTDPPVTTFDFYIGGSTTLTIDVLGVNVTASTTNVQPGQSVNFAAAPINFTRKAEISWSFDTLAYYPQIDVVSCNNQPTCNYAPTKSGRMQVCMYDEQSYPICDESPQVTVAAWINGAPPCRAKPVASYTRISLQYNSTDLHHTEPHMGQDYADSTGTPVFSADTGTVIYADWAGRSGYTVAVRSALPDPRGLFLDSYYYHLKEGSIVVARDQKVAAGQFLAKVNDSGETKAGVKTSWGSHLHFEQHTPTTGKGAFPVPPGKNDRKTGVQPCTF